MLKTKNEQGISLKFWGRMDRVIANALIHSHGVEYIDEGLRPSGRVAHLPHRTQDTGD